jgi:Zn-dependent protease
LGNILSNLDFSVITDALLTVIPALICIIIHEISHGFVAYKLGDNTAKQMGRLTLNPIKHIDIFGLVAMMVVHFGWAKPVPINPGNFKKPKRGMALTALAGPVSNILIAVIFLFLEGALLDALSTGSVGRTILHEINLTVIFSIYLAIFNILPIPPMDGSKVFFAIASDKTYFKLMRYERYGFLILIFISLSGRLGLPFADKFYGALATAAVFVYNQLFFSAQAGYDLVHLFIR